MSLLVDFLIYCPIIHAIIAHLFLLCNMNIIVFYVRISAFHKIFAAAVLYLSFFTLIPRSPDPHSFQVTKSKDAS